MAQAFRKRAERCRLVRIDPDHPNVAKFGRRRLLSELSDDCPTTKRAERETGLEEPGPCRGAPLDQEQSDEVLCALPRDRRNDGRGGEDTRPDRSPVCRANSDLVQEPSCRLVAGLSLGEHGNQESIRRGFAQDASCNVRRRALSVVPSPAQREVRLTELGSLEDPERALSRIPLLIAEIHRPALPPWVDDRAANLVIAQVERTSPP
jgi:hypothetical protein